MKRTIVFLILFLPVCVAFADDRKLRVNLTENAPLVYPDENGNAAGFYPEILRYIAKQEGWRLEFVHDTWKNSLQLLEDGNIDIVMSIARSEAREKVFDFSRETVIANWGQLSRHKGDEIKSLPDLQGKRVSGVSGNIHSKAFVSLVDSFDIDIEFVTTDDYFQSFELLQRGEVAAVVSNRFNTLRYIGQYNNTETTPIIFSPISLYFATTEGRNAEILDAIDRYVREGQKTQGSYFYRAMDTWIGTTMAKQFKFPEWAKLLLIGALLLVVVLLAAAFILRRQVAKRTAQISKKNRQLAESRDGLEKRVTERTWELAESEKKYSDLYENAPDMFYTADTTTRKVIQCNRTLLQATGFSKDEIVGKSVIELYHGASKAQREKQLSPAVLATTPISDMELRLLRKDGGSIEVALNVSVVRDEQGVTVQTRSILRDITERKRVADELTASEEKFRRMFEDSVVAMVLTNSDGRYVQVNRAMCETFGYSRSELLSMGPEDITYKDDIVPNSEIVRELWTGERDGNAFEKRYVRKNGQVLWGDVVVSPIRDSTGKVRHLLGQMIDITDRKRAEEALKESEESLRQSQKLESVGRLAGGVAHDFNNLLTTIIGYSNLVADNPGLDDMTSDGIREIKKSADRAALLTRQLLAFSRKQIMQPRQINLNEIIMNAKKMLARLIPANVAIDTKLSPDIWEIKADAGQIDQVIMNLVVNASDAMPGGGKIAIETQNIRIDGNGQREHPDVVPGDYVCLNVSDTGYGMDEETKGHIFDPFYTTKPTGKGVGLGLATVYGIVKQSDGYIRVRSERGAGSTFVLFFLAAAAEEKEAAILPAHTVNAIGNEAVLIVEDETALRKMVRRILEERGYSVIDASNGVEALSAIEQAGCPKVECLVTDMIMPEMGGRELSESLMETYPSLKTLFISGYAGESISRDGVLEDGFEFLQKPFTPETLAERIRELLDRD